MPKKLLVIALELVGAVLLYRGIERVYPPAALIVAGLAVLLVAIVVDS